MKIVHRIIGTMLVLAIAVCFGCAARAADSPAKASELPAKAAEPSGLKLVPEVGVSRGSTSSASSAWVRRVLERFQGLPATEGEGRFQL